LPFFAPFLFSLKGLLFLDISEVEASANEKQYAYVAGFQGTIVSMLHKCFFLAQMFQYTTKARNYRILYVMQIFYFHYVNVSFHYCSQNILIST